jgi:hypothetical protein
MIIEDTDRERERDRERDHSVMIILLVLCFPIGVRVVVGTYLFAASCSIFCLFFCCYTLIFILSSKKWVMEIAVANSGSSESFGC